MSNYFVDPETVQLPINEEGDWIEIKKELTYGEEQRLAGAALGNVQGMREGQSTEVALDWERYSIQRLLIWLVDWSFTDNRGKRVRVSKEAIANLKPSIAQAIQEAIDEYIKSTSEAKKVTSGTGTESEAK